MSKFSRSILSLALIALAVSPLGAAAEPQPSAQQIVAAADAVRNPAEPFRTTTTLVEYVSAKPKDQSVLTVYAKTDPATGQFRNLVRFVEPARDEGKVVLLDNHNLWFYDPASKASVRISPQQRLLGQAAIADVLTVNFAADYQGDLLGTETVPDSTRQPHQCWHLDLKPANDQAIYNHIEYWVESSTSYPIKAKFYADSGRLLKTLYYRDFAEQLGRTRPTGAVIIDAVDATLVTTVKFDEPKFQDIPDAWFQHDALARLKAE
jgi:outer membrane lipoprotein-sorting protein